LVVSDWWLMPLNTDYRLLITDDWPLTTGH
jgi:hypothetical protein